MCIYLLQMREFFRWEKGFAAMQALPHDQLGAWLTEREALWESLENGDFGRLLIDQRWFEPFDVAAINARLRSMGLVYGAGLLGPGRASFFLGALESVQQRDGARLLISGREYARGLLSPPAALSGSTIYLRRESLTRWLWQKFEAWTLRRPNGAFRSVLNCYGFEQDGPVALERMATAQGESLILHELGEFAAAKLLGSRWQDLRNRLACRHTELSLRAMRDHLADCLVTLPTLLERGPPASIHFWFSNLEGLRAELFPQAALAYTSWCGGDGGQALMTASTAGRAHWRDLCEQVLALHAAQNEGEFMHIQRLMASKEARL